MKSINAHETSFLYRIFLFLIVLITGLVLTYLVFTFVILLHSGFNTSVFKDQMAGLITNVFSLRLMQILQSFFVFILPPFILANLYRENPKIFLHLRKPDFTTAFIGIASILLMIPLINVLVSWNAGLHLPESLQGLETWMRTSEDTAEKVTQLMLKGTAWYDLIINLFIVGVLAGVGEELLFRGFLQSLFAKEIGQGSRLDKKPDWVMHATIWLVAFLFSAIHLQFYGFFPRLLLGAWFGYLLWWSGSIWVPILAHFTNNAFSTIATFSENKGLISKDPDQLGLNETWWLCLISIVLLTGCIYYLKFARKK